MVHHAVIHISMLATSGEPVEPHIPAVTSFRGEYECVKQDCRRTRVRRKEQDGGQELWPPINIHPS